MKVFCTGAYGLVGSRFVELMHDRFDIIGSDRGDAPFDLPVASFVRCDITDTQEVSRVFDQTRPDAVIHFAAYTDVDEAEKQKGDKTGSAWAINVKGTEHVVQAAKDVGSHTIVISTGHVFGGEHAPNTEETKPDPLSWYGVTKAEAERVAQEIDPNVCIARIHYPFRQSFPFKTDMVRSMIDKLKGNTLPPMFTDQQITPTYIDDIAHGLSILLEKKIVGLVHLVGSSSHTPYEIATILAQTFFPEKKMSIQKTTLTEFSATHPSYAPRPLDDRMESKRCVSLGLRMHKFSETLSLMTA
ncbi:MAG: SDR family oxidoreductase [Candidatus Daviesbacteria bacterium]|nr:SDR family oxidoreductase [Candidatus Daviesbacteria bacterium]